MKRPTSTRWTRSDLYLIVLLSVKHLDGYGYGAGIREILETVNQEERDVPSLYGYLHAAERDGHALSTKDGSTRIYSLTVAGQAFLNRRLGYMRASYGAKKKKRA